LSSSCSLKELYVILSRVENQHEYYTPSQAARILRLTRQRVAELLRNGEVEGYKDDVGHWRISKAALHAYKEARDESRAEKTLQPDLLDRLVDAERELGRLEGRAQLTEVAESTLRDQLQRERERADRLEAALQAEREKGFWKKLFGK
jgi:excisionase family DNA binding protein